MNAPVYNPTAPRLRPFPGARGWNTRNPWIYVGTIAGSQKARVKPGSLIAPLDADPLSFTWPARDLQVTLIGEDAKDKEGMRVVQALIRDGAALVVYIRAPSGHASYHKQQPTENA